MDNSVTDEGEARNSRDMILQTDAENKMGGTCEQKGSSKENGKQKKTFWDTISKESLEKCIVTRDTKTDR